MAKRKLLFLTQKGKRSRGFPHCVGAVILLSCDETPRLASQPPLCAEQGNSRRAGLALRTVCSRQLPCVIQAALLPWREGGVTVPVPQSL